MGTRQRNPLTLTVTLTLTLALSLTLTLGVGVRVGIEVLLWLVYFVLEHELLGRRGLDGVTKYRVLIGPRPS